MITGEDLQSVVLTVKVAAISTGVMLVLGTPIAWWLATTKSHLKSVVSAITSLPLVLPPTVLGFYLLLMMRPEGPIGYVTQHLGMGILPFSFSGLVVASILYSVPFVVQPLYAAFSTVEKSYLEVASTLGASPFDSFFSVVVPLCKNGYIMAAVLGFAHTVGEFGVVLMIGGNIPNATRLVSVQLYNHVEAQRIDHAHWLAGGLLVFSFLTLFILFSTVKSNRLKAINR